MNIEQLFPGTDLKVYKVTNILSDKQTSLLKKLAEGKVPSGYRQDEIDQAVADIRKASVEACQNIFKVGGLEANAHNTRWPWFDLSEGEGRTDSDSETFDADGIERFFAEFGVQASTSGGEMVFTAASEEPIKLNLGEMLVFPRSKGHEFAIKTVGAGVRFTLLTPVSQTFK